MPCKVGGWAIIPSEMGGKFWCFNTGATGCLGGQIGTIHITIGFEITDAGFNTLRLNFIGTDIANGNSIIITVRRPGKTPLVERRAVFIVAGIDSGAAGQQGTG